GHQRQQEWSFRQSRNQGLAAGPHATEGTAAIHRPQHQEEAPQRQQINEKDEIAARAQKRRAVQQRNKRRNHLGCSEQDDGGEAKNKRSRSRDEILFAKELEQIGVRPPHARAAPILDSGFELG